MVAHKVHGEESVGGLGLAVGRPLVVASAEVRVVPADVGQGGTGGAVDHDAGTVGGGQERVELAGEGEVSELVGGELALPTWSHVPFGDGCGSVAGTC